jgi:hypothetical protein
LIQEIWLASFQVSLFQHRVVLATLQHRDLGTIFIRLAWCTNGLINSNVESLDQYNLSSPLHLIKAHSLGLPRKCLRIGIWTRIWMYCDP